MKPDFLCIGAQKAGTTWLYQALRQHPQVQMPPIKEIHYFDRGKRPYAFDLLAKDAPTRRRFLRWLRDGLRSSRAGWSEALWNIRFFCLPRSDRWYAALFPPCDDLLAGDITPGTPAWVKTKWRMCSACCPTPSSSICCGIRSTGRGRRRPCTSASITLAVQSHV